MVDPLVQIPVKFTSKGCKECPSSPFLQSLLPVAMAFSYGTYFVHYLCCKCFFTAVVLTEHQKLMLLREEFILLNIN